MKIISSTEQNFHVSQFFLIFGILNTLASGASLARRGCHSQGCQFLEMANDSPGSMLFTCKPHSPKPGFLTTFPCLALTDKGMPGALIPAGAGTWLPGPVSVLQIRLKWSKPADPQSAWSALPSLTCANDDKGCYPCFPRSSYCPTNLDDPPCALPWGILCPYFFFQKFIIFGCAGSSLLPGGTMKFF